MQRQWISKKKLAHLCKRILVQQLVPLSIMLLIGMNVSLAQAVSLSEQEELHHRAQQEAKERRSREQSKDTFLQKTEKPIDDIEM